MGPSSSKNKMNELRKDLILNPNVKQAVIHNKDETTFIKHDMSGQCYVYNVEHPNYNKSYYQIAVQMASRFINSQTKYISDT